MESQQEHIATLCAAGTVGIAATGFALASLERSLPLTAPVRRNWPGASSVRSPSPPRTSYVPRRAISQPGTSSGPPNDGRLTIFPATDHRKRKVREIRAEDGHYSDVTGSRGSSLNRTGVLRPRTALSRSASERRETSTGSSWLKRISTVSSLAGSSPATSIHQLDGSSTQGSLLRPTTSHHAMPNKLVKRSTSQRGVSYDQAKGTFLRRPATSHQRSAALRDTSLPEHPYLTPAMPEILHQTTADTSSPPVWRPFFERGYPKKRHSLPNATEQLVLRTISVSTDCPTLILGSSIEQQSLPKKMYETPSAVNPPVKTVSTGRHRLRRSLSSMQKASRRRFFTEPVAQVANDTATGTISSTMKQSPISPISNVSTFEVDLPSDSPAFMSSPPFIPVRHRFSFRKRDSTIQSDPTTLSSDNDTRIFSDDESMDFHSDTPYDSLTNRATVGGHSAARSPKLDMIFNEPAVPSLDESGVWSQHTAQSTTSTNSDISNRGRTTDKVVNHGIGIHGIDQTSGRRSFTEALALLTPAKTGHLIQQNPSDTSISSQQGYGATNVGQELQSVAPPPQTPCHVNHEPTILYPLPIEEEEEIEWSPNSDSNSSAAHTELPIALDSPLKNKHAISQQTLTPTYHDASPSDGDRRMTIFDWSENQRVSDGLGGVEARPKTVHGKQGHDNARSRSSGRKAPNQMHLRSQSVPNNRDPNTEPVPLTTSKFGTWGLGHKPVSEEWSEDFEFDDLDESSEASLSLAAGIPSSEKRESIGGVKVPQSIIDRQASVHVQFGQVQEFMMLVEELKRLRIRGATLDLLEGSSTQLWEDAESIINLATINDEEEEFGHIRTRSPTVSDIFDDVSVVSRSGISHSTTDESQRNSIAHRTMSSPATPPFGRPRGESLAQAKNFLQSIHQNRSGIDSSPLHTEEEPQKKLPFDTQDLKDLVARSGAITRALKEIVRRSEGVSVSPSKTPNRTRDPAFSQIFHTPHTSPCPPSRGKPGLPKSKSANSYLSSSFDSGHTNSDVPNSFPFTATAMV